MLVCAFLITIPPQPCFLKRGRQPSPQPDIWVTRVPSITSGVQQIPPLHLHLTQISHGIEQFLVSWENVVQMILKFSREAESKMCYFFHCSDKGNLKEGLFIWFMVERNTVRPGGWGKAGRQWGTWSFCIHSQKAKGLGHWPLLHSICSVLEYDVPTQVESFPSPLTLPGNTPRGVSARWF